MTPSIYIIGYLDIIVSNFYGKFYWSKKDSSHAISPYGFKNLDIKYEHMYKATII